MFPPAGIVGQCWRERTRVSIRPRSTRPRPILTTVHGILPGGFVSALVETQAVHGEGPHESSGPSHDDGTASEFDPLGFG